MEEIIQSPIGNFIFSGFIFFIQLYFRSVLAGIDKDISGIKKNYEDQKQNITKLFGHIDRITAIEVKTENAGSAIAEIKTDIHRIEDKCDRVHGVNR